MEKHGNVSVCSAATGLVVSKCDQMVDNDHVVQFLFSDIEQQRQTLTILCLKSFMLILIFYFGGKILNFVFDYMFPKQNSRSICNFPCR